MALHIEAKAQARADHTGQHAEPPYGNGSSLYSMKSANEVVANTSPAAPPLLCRRSIADIVLPL
ncbi:hypothetical protein ACO0LB_08265 [Undibacterium sp. SXout7W]|uniref:hypothetical protein n=1 Tax=Undibacterium sp. SXout7W TaxID=3413049 RepID=UPI003BF18D8E